MHDFLLQKNTSILVYHLKQERNSPRILDFKSVKNWTSSAGFGVQKLFNTVRTSRASSRRR